MTQAKPAKKMPRGKRSETVAPLNAETAVEATIKAITRLLEAASRKTSHRLLETFRTFVRLSEASLRLAPQEEWKELVRGHEPACTEYSHALGELMLYHLRFGYRDVIGELYMHLDIASARAGQFFTPWHVAFFMAQMNFHGLTRVPTREDPIRVLDPSCGSGVMLLAAAACAPREWVEQELIRFYGIDIDHTCSLMATLNLRLHGLSGTIVWVVFLIC